MQSAELPNEFHPNFYADWLRTHYVPLLEAIEEAIIATDLAGKILYWSRAAQRVYGWSAEEVLGQKIGRVCVPFSERENAGRILEFIRQGSRWSGEILLQRRCGTSFLGYASVGPIRLSCGTIIGSVGTSYDLR